MREYVSFNDIAGVLCNEQRKYFGIVFSLLNRKLSMREFAMILRAKERGLAAKRVVGRLIPIEATLESRRLH